MFEFQVPDHQQLIDRMLRLAAEEGRAAGGYRAGRGLSDETVALVRLGYAPASGQALASHFSSLGLSAEAVEKSGLVLRDAVAMIAAGMAIGLPCVAALGKLVQSQLFGVTATDPATVAVAALILAAGALPDEVMRRVPRVVATGAQHGTVTVLFGEHKVEVTAVRGEGAYLDGRRPSAVTFLGDIDGGRITVDGVDTRDLTRDDLRRALEEREEELAAAREANRRLMAQLNSTRP